MRDSTQYFVLIFFFHIIAQLFVSVAPVGDTIHSGVVIWVVLTARALSAQSPALTGVVSSLLPRRRSVTYIDINSWRRANAVLIPAMASRLTLSLKKATAQPKIPSSLETMTNTSRGRSTGDGTIDPAPRVPEGSHEILRASAAPNDEDIELGAMPRLSSNRDSRRGS